MDEEAMENLRGGEGAGDEESLARGVTTDSNTIDDTANAVSIHGNQVSQQHGAGSHDGDDQQVHEADQEVRDLAADSSGGNDLLQAAAAASADDWQQMADFLQFAEEELLQTPLETEPGCVEDAPRSPALGALDNLQRGPETILTYEFSEPVHREQVPQQHGAGLLVGDSQQVLEANQEVRALAAASSGGKELPETANFKDLGADANSDSRETDSVDQRDEGDDFHPLTESSNATAGGNAGSGALQANNASKPTKEESLKATINEELRSVENARQGWGATQADETRNAHVEDHPGYFFRYSLRDGALDEYRDNLTNIRTYLDALQTRPGNDSNDFKQCKSHFVDLDKIRQPIEKALEIGGLASDFDYLDYLELWGGYNQSDITDLLDFLKRLVTNTNSKSKKMSTIWSNAQKRVENGGPHQIGRNGSMYKFSQRVVDHLVELSESQHDSSTHDMQRKIIAWRAWCNVQTITELVRGAKPFRAEGNQFGLMNNLLSKYVDERGLNKLRSLFMKFNDEKAAVGWRLRRIGWLLCGQRPGRPQANPPEDTLPLAHFAKWTAAILFMVPEKFLAKSPEKLRVWLEDVVRDVSKKGNNKASGQKRSSSSGSAALSQSNTRRRTNGNMGQVPLATLARLPMLSFRYILEFVQSQISALFPFQVPQLMGPSAPESKHRAKPRVRGVSSTFVKLLGRFIASNTPDEPGRFTVNAFQVANLLAEKMDREVDDEEGGFTGLESFLGSERGAAMRNELLRLAEDPAEKDTSTWFDKATHFVCYHPERPFQTVIDSLVDDSQPRAYWWIDLVSNARPRGQNDSTRVDSFVAIRTTQSFAMVIDDWQNPSVVSRGSCRAEIAVAVDEGRILRAVMSKAVREDLVAFSNKVMRSKQDEAPEDDRRDGQAEIDKLSDALQSQGKSLEASNKYSAQIDLKTRLAIIEVILKPAKDLIRQHTGPGNPTPLLNLIERSLDVVDATNAFVALAPAFTIQGRLAEGINMLERIAEKVSKELHGTSKPSRARCADLENVLGRALFSMGRLYCDSFSGDKAVACAELCCDAAIAILEACGDPLCARAQYVLARTLVNCHMTITSFSARDKAADTEKATKMLDAAIASMERDNALQADLGALYVHRAKLSDLSGKPASVVEEDFERAIGVQVDLYGPCDPRLNLTSKCRGQSWFWRGDVAKAVFHWTQSFSHIFDGFAAHSVPAYHVFKILSFSWIGFAKLREERSEMSFQEQGFVARTVEPYFVQNRERLFEELEGYYPGEAVQCDEIGFDWIATSLRRILVVEEDARLDAAIKDELFADYQVDLVTTVEGAKQKLAEHIYAAVLVASDSVAASALAAHRTISSTEVSSTRPHSKLIRFSDEELDDDGEFDVHRPADLQSVLLDAFFEPTARLAVAFAKLPRMSPHLAA